MLKDTVTPGQALSALIQQELAQYLPATDKTLSVTIPYGFRDRQPQSYYLLTRYRSQPCIIVQCDLGDTVILNFEIMVGFCTDFTSPLRKVHTEKAVHHTKFYNLQLSLSQARFFLHHVILVGNFPKRTLTTG